MFPPLKTTSISASAQASTELQTTLAKVIELFHQTFIDENVVLQGGSAEPFYQAPRLQNSHWQKSEIHFTYDYLNSCLHEVAHWCLAGKTRRTQDDYGYWYAPDGRSADQQMEFFQAEAGPQALEWILALACKGPFWISTDNLSCEVKGAAEFEKKLHEKLKQFMEKKIPPRGNFFFRRLMQEFHPEVLPSHIDNWLWKQLGLIE